MDRKDIARKIKALLAKQVVNGATEAEAMIAARKAAELMAEYNISMTEAEVLAEGFEMQLLAYEDKITFLVRRSLSTGVATFTDTRIWLHGKTTIRFFGLRSDVIFARFLHDSLTEFVMRRVNAFIEQELTDFAKQYNVSLEKARQRLDFSDATDNFVIGITTRITERLKETKVHARVRSESGPGLVPINKWSLVTKQLSDQYHISLKRGTITSQSGSDHKAHEAGRKAGNDARFSKPVNGGNGVRMLPNGRNAY